MCFSMYEFIAGRMFFWEQAISSKKLLSTRTRISVVSRLAPRRSAWFMVASLTLFQVYFGIEEQSAFSQETAQSSNVSSNTTAESAEKPMSDIERERQAALDSVADLPEEQAAATDAELDGGPEIIARKKTEKEEKAESYTWNDIEVVQKKPHSKRLRLSIRPFAGSTINDAVVQHSLLGGDIAFNISDGLAIYAQGVYWIKNVLEPERAIRAHLNRIPDVNFYHYTASGNFSYVPIRGKHSIFNNSIWYFDAWISAGAGITKTETIPRDFKNEAFTHMALTFPLAFGARVFFNDWIAFSVTFRDYILLDRYENIERTSPDGAQAKEDAETAFVNNLAVTAGFEFYLPFHSRYRKDTH